jgi:hypothetical protein
MSENGKLQRAVELTIASGYQLDREAFEFLSIVAVTEDPAEIISRAIRVIADLADKPMFIGREFLEQLLKGPEQQKEVVIQPTEGPTRKVTEPNPPLTEAKKPFHPYSKEIDAKIDIIEDPGAKLDSNGTVEGYLGYFRDR